MCRWPRTPRAACCRWPRTSRTSSASSCWPAPGLRLPRAPAVERRASSACARALRSDVAASRRRPPPGARPRQGRRPRPLRRHRRGRRHARCPSCGRSPLPSLQRERVTLETAMTRIDNARVIRAPHGTDITAKSWLTEAPLRMLMNNLDPDVAEKPERARRLRRHRPRRARLGELRPHRRRAAPARGRRDAAGAVRQAGRRVPHAHRRAARADRQLQPRAALGHAGALQRARPQGPDDVRPDDGRLLDLHRQPGHRAGHLRDLRRGRPAPLRRQPRRQMDPDRRPRRHGRRAAARRRRWPAPRCWRSNASRAASRCASRPATSTRRPRIARRGARA